MFELDTSNISPEADKGVRDTLQEAASVRTPPSLDSNSIIDILLKRIDHLKRQAEYLKVHEDINKEHPDRSLYCFGLGDILMQVEQVGRFFEVAFNKLAKEG